MDIKSLFFLLGIASILVIIYTLFYRVMLPTLYFISIVVLGVSIAITVIGSNKKQSFLLLFLTTLVSRNAYYLATQYSVIPFGDPYIDLGVVETFAERNNIFRIQMPLGHPYLADLTWYSQWPLLDVFTLIFSWLSGISSFYSMIILPSVFSSCLFLFAYLFLNKISQALNISHVARNLSLVLFISSPEIIYYSFTFLHQSVGMIFSVAIAYLLCKLTANSNRRRSPILLLVIFGFSLIIAHHLTSFTVVAYILIFSVLITIIKYKSKKVHSFFTNIPFWRIGIAFMFTLLLWWSTYARVSWTLAYPKIIESLTGGVRITPFVPEVNWPPSLTPDLGLWFLGLRDILTYVSGALGFLFLVRRRRRLSPAETFLVLSTVTFGILFAADFLVVHIDPYRIVMMSLVFVVSSVGILFEGLRKYSIKIACVIGALFIALITTSSFIGLWAHRYLPMHLYDLSVNPLDVGEHSPGLSRLREWLLVYFDYDHVEAVYGDDTYALFMILPPKVYGKIESLRENYTQAIVTAQIVVEMRELNLYEHFKPYSFPMFRYEDNEAAKKELGQFLSLNFIVIYDDKDFRVWIRAFEDE